MAVSSFFSKYLRAPSWGAAFLKTLSDTRDEVRCKTSSLFFGLAANEITNFVLINRLFEFSRLLQCPGFGTVAEIEIFV